MKNYHFKLDIRGVLMRGDHALRGLLQDDKGRPLTVDEAKRELLDELAQGHVVLPVGGPCLEFDYSGPGCPGHDVGEE